MFLAFFRWPLGRPLLRQSLAWALLWGGGALLPAAALDLVDDAGQRLQLAAVPVRIVSLLPSLTETVCALGACQQLVGVDRYSNWPAAVQKLPQVGGGLDPSIEAIVALRPDLVLLDTSTRAAERLRQLGVPVLALRPRVWADWQRVTRQLGAVLQRPEAAEALLRSVDAEVRAAAQALPPAARGQRVYYEVDAAPHAAGQGTFIDELLRALGLVNILPAALGPYPQINPEFVVRADPDRIMVSSSGARTMAQRPGWAGLRALQPGRLCGFAATERDILVRPGPRMAEAARLMADCVRK